MKKKDLSGRRFGRLTALYPTEKRSGGSVVWHCKCDCGREIELSYNRLVHGKAKSCRCLLKEHESPGKYLHYVENTCVENLEFQGLRKNNTSGHTGVVAYRGKWRAQIMFQRKNYVIGSYEKIEDAVKARRQAEQHIFGEFLEWYYENHPEKETRRQRLQQEP